MIYTELTEAALTVAYHAFHGMIDFAEVPLIFTYYEIASNMNTEDEVVVALIYDVLKTDSFSLDDFELLGFTPTQIESVKILSNYWNKNSNDYLESVRKNKIARKVKLAELNHNLNTSRYLKITQIEREKLARYKQIKNYLL